MRAARSAAGSPRGWPGPGSPYASSAETRPGCPGLPGTAAAPPATYGDGEAMRRALDGAHTLFLVSAHESPDRVREHTTAVDAAVAAGVERVVYVSFLGAAPDATFTFARDHWYTEAHIRMTGVRHTFLRDGWYLAGIPAMTAADGVLRGPGGEGRVSAVSHDDIADSASAVLLDEGTAHDGATYDLTGPVAFTLAEAAGELSRRTGRADPVRVRDRGGGLRLPRRLRRPGLGGGRLGHVVRGDRGRGTGHRLGRRPHPHGPPGPGAWRPSSRRTRTATATSCRAPPDSLTANRNDNDRTLPAGALPRKSAVRSPEHSDRHPAWRRLWSSPICCG